MGIGNKVVWVGVEMGRGHQAGSVLFVGRQCHFVCLWGGGWAGSARSGIKCCSSSKVFVTLIFLDHVYYCEIFLARFLISFVFNKAVVAFGFTKRPQSFLIEFQAFIYVI